MRVAAVQFKARATFEASLEALLPLVRRAGQGADLVVCPEMALRGYAISTREQALAVAEPANGPTAAALAAIARDFGAWIVCGIPERAGDRVYNAAIVINAAGELAFCYRKTLLFEADEAWATPGDSGYRSFDTDNGRFGVGICMDLNDDRFLAWCAGAALDVIAMPTNWVASDDNDVHDYWRWRLMVGWPADLGLPDATVIADRPRVDALLVAANSYGQEGVYQLEGRSSVLTWGRIVAQAPLFGDAVLTAALSRPRARR